MMDKLLILFLTLFTLDVIGQDNLTELAQPIVAEGKLLYQSEMASWHGTDLFLEAYKERSKIGGYFSYIEGDSAKCLFFAKGDNPRVIGTVSFDQTYNTNAAAIDLGDRAFSALEHSLYTIRKIALAEINADTLFKTYKNTNLNLIPLITETVRKVYVLTGPTENGVMIIGNDYLLTFDTDNKLTSKKQLHKNIIPIQFAGKELEGKNIESSMHSHLPETGDFITATDICTLMLYQRFAKWKTHNVISKEYFNIWNCETNELLVLTTEAIHKITEDQKSRNRKRRKG